MKRLLSALLLCWSLLAGQAYAATAALLVGTADAGNTPNTSGAFTPTLGDLLVVLVSVRGSVDATPTLSSSTGMTFSLVGTTAGFSGSKDAWGDTNYAFVSNALVTDTSSQTVTWIEASDPGGGSIIFVHRVSGMARTGLDAVLQAAKQDGRSAGYSIFTQFSSAVLTGNVTLGIVGNRTNPAGIDPPSGWTEPAGGDIGHADPSGAETVYRNSGFTGSTITWGSYSASQSGALSIELDTTATSSCPATCAGGRTGVCITDTASNTDPDNILYGQSPAVVANEDTICHDATSTLSAAVTVSAAGWVSLASGGSNLTDDFDYCIMDNGDPCGTDGTFQITETPVLSSPLGVQTGQTTADLSVSVAQVEGTVWACVSEDSGTPSHAQGAAGNDANGDPCAFDASDATPSASQAFSATGLTADTVYYASFGQSNAATAPLTATVVKSAAFQTEAAGDTTPDAFSFADVTGAVGGYEYVSSAIEIAGTTAATNVVITISGCEYAIDSGSGYGSYTSAAGVVQLGYGVRLRNTASLEALDTANCTPTIGGVSDTWYVTTRNETLVDFVNRLVRQLVQPLVDQGVK